MTVLHSRRSLLRNAFAISVIIPSAASAKQASCQIVRESTSLSHESAEGFRQVIEDAGVRRHIAWSNLVILASASAISNEDATELRERCEAGSWIIWEMSPSFTSGAAFERQKRLLNDVFGVSTGELVAMREPMVRSRGMYIRYSWPAFALTRTFLSYVPVASTHGAIAHHADCPVAMKLNVGKGGVIYLGSLLGPHVRAGDRDATRIAGDILAAPGTAPI